MKILTPLTVGTGAIGLCAVLLSGCMTDNKSDVTISTPDVAWTGKSSDSIQYASQLQFFNGHLIVGNRLATHPGTAVIDTATGTISAYYDETLPPSSMAVTSDSQIIITETDYKQGAVSVLNVSGQQLQKSVISFGSDNFVDTAGGKVYLFDHTTGAVTGFTGHEPNQNIVFNAQTGGSGVSNPYDIAIANNLAFIPRFDSKSLLILDPTKLGGGTPDSIDLSAYVSKVVSDSAFLPRMAWATSYNGYVFVALQRLNVEYADLDTSLVVVISASTKQIASVIPLHFRNPVSAHAVGSTWYLTSVAGYDQSGGVEKIDLSQRINAGAILQASAMSADLFDFVPFGTHSGYVAYSTDYGVTTKVKKVTF